MLTIARRRTAMMVNLSILCLILGATLLWALYTRLPFMFALVLGLLFTLCAVFLIYCIIDRDSVSARQSAEVLELASKMLACAQEGLTPEASQKICDMLLPTIPALAVALTDREVILGYAGYDREDNQAGTPIRTTATHQTLADGIPRVLNSRKEIGLPDPTSSIGAAIIHPLIVGHKICGTMKFYYRGADKINQTQKALTNGFAELLSTQMAAAALEEQTMLATSMELKALQAQINPHFLFNTINTIASLIRTDPDKARTLLREFAVFYRSMLEDAQDLIELEREIRQVERYFMLEVARFGEERLELKIDIEDEMYAMMVPSFMIQPLVENSVRHGLPAEGKLTVTIVGRVCEPNVMISVCDDGNGMSEDTMATMIDAGSRTGMGIAMKNVKERMRAYYGPDARMDVESSLGEGTVVSFTLDKKSASSGWLS